MMDSRRPAQGVTGGLTVWKTIRNGNGRLIHDTEDTYARWERAQGLVESGEY